MSKKTIASLFSSLCLGGLLVAACGTPSRRFDRGGGGSAGVVSSGGGSAAGRGGSGAGGAGGAKPSAGTGAMSVGIGGDDSIGSSGAGGEGLPECTAKQKRCGGTCVDIDDPTYGCDPTLCTTTGCPDASGATLVCNAGQCLLGSCGTGTKKCNGRCVSLTDPAYGCGATTCDATTCPSQGTGATLTCQGSACVVGGCPTNYKKCGDKCVAISDPTYGCGATTCDASSCPPAGTGTLVCQNSVCATGTCGAGSKKCGSNCVTTDANNGCADASRCTACATNEACSGTPTTCQCVPTPMATACTGKCGPVSNGCGGTYTCSACTSPQTCGGGGTPNLCGCTPIASATACSGKNCGSVSNGCGGNYTCGTCTSPQSCAGGGTANVCGGCTKTAMTTACANKNCGSVSDGCGGNYTCGTCSSPQSCAGGGTANVCGGCTKTAMTTACANKSCGSVSDGCGGNYTCGTCSSPSPICVNSTCKQCNALTDCPSGTFNCTNNACVCRTPNSANIIKDGGFDSQSSVSSWTPSGITWTGNSDADACPLSGSMTINDTVSRCFQIPTVPAGGKDYALGIRYKTAAGANGGCYGSFNQDASCAQGVGPDFLNLGASESTSWTTTSTVNTVYEGTASILVQCQIGGGSMTIDQIFLRPSGYTGPGF